MAVDADQDDEHDGENHTTEVCPGTRTRRAMIGPSKAERAQHELTHLPYRT